MTISKSDFEKKYNSMKNTDLANELGVSIATLYNMLDRYGIKKKGRGNREGKSIIKVVD